MDNAIDTPKSPKFQDLRGRTFTRLTVVEYAGRSTDGRTLWKCTCTCGNVTTIPAQRLKSGNTRSCGCLHKEQLSLQRRKHGRRDRTKYCRTYEAWRGAKARVTRKNHRHAKHYAAKGIGMCERWLNSFEAFLEDMGECPPGMSLDRIDNNGNYEPGNCRWATQLEQIRNRSITRTITVDGVKRPLAEVAEEHGLSPKLVASRLNKGWSVIDALRPVKRASRPATSRRDPSPYARQDTVPYTASSAS